MEEKAKIKKLNKEIKVNNQIINSQLSILKAYRKTIKELRETNNYYYFTLKLVIILVLIVFISLIIMGS